MLNSILNFFKRWELPTNNCTSKEVTSKFFATIIVFINHHLCMAHDGFFREKRIYLTLHFAKMTTHMQQYKRPSQWSLLILYYDQFQCLVFVCMVFCKCHKSIQTVFVVISNIVFTQSDLFERRNKIELE